MAIDLIKRRGPGQPTKLTAKTEAIIYEYMAKGNYISTACQAAGIDSRTFYYWQNKASSYHKYLEDNNIEVTNIDALPDNGTGGIVYYQFFQRLKRAEAEAESAHVGNLMKAGAAGPQFWAASATYLERKHPDRWGKRDAVDINVREGTALLEKLAAVLQIKAP